MITCVFIVLFRIIPIEGSMYPLSVNASHCKKNIAKIKKWNWDPDEKKRFASPTQFPRDSSELFFL